MQQRPPGECRSPPTSAPAQARRASASPRSAIGSDSAANSSAACHQRMYSKLSGKAASEDAVRRIHDQPNDVACVHVHGFSSCTTPSASGFGNPCHHGTHLKTRTPEADCSPHPPRRRGRPCPPRRPTGRRVVRVVPAAAPDRYARPVCLSIICTRLLPNSQTIRSPSRVHVQPVREPEFAGIRTDTAHVADERAVGFENEDAVVAGVGDVDDVFVDEDRLRPDEFSVAVAELAELVRGTCRRDRTPGCGRCRHTPRRRCCPANRRRCRSGR